jgi:nitrogenase molybdenum-cofactor synthesis protein NifE
MESQKTCKLFGAIRVVLGIKGALPIIHGPLGCSYHIRYLLRVRSGKSVRILSTAMDQNDVVFGAEEKLKSKIIETDQRYTPELIVVLTSCASSIIGENTGKIIKDVKNSVNAEIMDISAGGFEGTQIDGYEECLLCFIQLMKKTKKRNSVNLVGQFRGGEDLKYLKEYFKKLNIEINCVLMSNSNLNQIKEAGNASLNVSMCEASGIVPCEVMKKELEIPYINEILPIGVKGTSNFFNRICKEMDKKYLLKNEEINTLNRIKKYSENLKGKKAAIIAGPSRVLAFIDFLLEIGMEPILICIDFQGKNTIKELEKIIKRNKINPIILIEPEYFEIQDQISKNKPDIILGGLGEIGLSKESNIPLIDVMHANKSTMGFNGALELVKNIKEALQL